MADHLQDEETRRKPHEGTHYDNLDNFIHHGTNATRARTIMSEVALARVQCPDIIYLSILNPHQHHIMYPALLNKQRS